MFLDEIGEMVPALQAKLLRFLEEKAFKRVGGSHDIRVDVRVIAATNRNLENEVQAGQFREDLFYRLNVLPIALPPLRAHLDDVPALVGLLRRPVQPRVPQAGARRVARRRCASCSAYGWPGNIRELRNAVERAMLLAEGDVARAARLPGARGQRAGRATASRCRPRA